MKVRFCPSPTGVPHVGLLRTALYNWYHAKHNGGQFLFRLEDTDDSRNTLESRAQIVKALVWLGITPDEGYTVDDGVAVFDEDYVQSNRNGVYADVLQKLVDAGRVYKSFSTKDEIDARNTAAGRPLNKGYDNFDRNMDDETVAELEAAGVPFVYRFRLPDTDITIQDMIRGSVLFPAAEFVDFPVARGDGKFLYNFVNPVDDALMGVTDILRGEDLLPSTGKQVALWSALHDLGLTDVGTPKYGHLPYIMGSDRKKLSKRDSSSDFFHLVREGFTPEGLINYLMLLGWGQTEQDLFTNDELTALFDVSTVNSNPAQFDMKKAMAINAEHIRSMDSIDFSILLVKYLKQYSDLDIQLDNEILIYALAGTIQTRVQVMSDAVPYLRNILGDYTPAKVTGVDRNNIVFVRDVLAGIEGKEFRFAGDYIANAIEASDGAFSNKTVFRPLGKVLSGEKRFLPPNNVIIALGKDETLKLLNAAL